MFTTFFLHRRVLGIVISIIITLIGALSIFSLPIAQYPKITPPTVQVGTAYVGASANAVEQAVAIPVESRINGAEGMLYMNSQSSSNGSYGLTITFEVGTNIDIAAVDIQNRVKGAEGSLPNEVKLVGLSAQKQAPDMLMLLTVYSPDHTYDELFISNYTAINLLDRLARVPGVGGTSSIGQGNYSMRLWLRPDKLAKLGLTANDVINAVADQNVQAPAGQVGQPPAPPGTQFQYPVNMQGRLNTPEAYDNIIIRQNTDGSVVRLRDVARSELGAQSYTSFGRVNGVPATVIVVYQLPGANALDTAKGVRATMKQLAANFPPGLQYEISMDATTFVRTS